MPDLTDPDADVDLILTDARDQAQRILDESMERARTLIASRSAAPASDQAVREVRSAITDLTTEIRDVQHRLDRIEALLRQDRIAPSASPAAIPTTAPAATPTATPTPRARQAPPSAAFSAPSIPPLVHREPAPEPDSTRGTGYDTEPESEPFAPPAATAPSAPVPPPPPLTPPAPPRTPSFSVVPQRPGWPPAVEPADSPGTVPGESAPPRSAVPPIRPAPPAAGVEADLRDEPDLEEPEGDEAPIATFLPGEGTLVLRVMPVSGFQGLMRVQDALARLPFVRHAAVEAYSQGEARLRIELMEPTDSDEIAAGLSERLQEPAHVRSASEADRELLIALR